MAPGAKDESALPTIDQLLDRVNPSGLWQISVFFQIILPLIFINTLVYEENYLLAGGMQHRCVDGDSVSPNGSVWASVGSSEQCEGCSKFDYRSEYYQSTIVESFDLVCTRRTWVPIYKSMYVIGFFLGVPLWGWLSDRFGRRPLLIFLAPCVCLLAFAVSQSTTLWMMLIVRIMFGLVHSGYWKSAFIMNVEIAPERARNWMNILIEINWPMGGAMAALFGYFLRDWRTLHAYSVIPALISIPLAFLTPESPRWLVTNGRFKQAIQVFKRAARFGGDTKAVPDAGMLKRIHDAHRSKIGVASRNERSIYMQLVRSPIILRRTLVLMLQWNFLFVAFFGIFFYSTGGVGGGSPYLSLWLSGLFRCLVHYPLILCLNRFGMRPIIFTTLSVVSLLMACMAALPDAEKYVIWGVWIQVAAMVFADMALNTAYAFTSELYPTVMRQTGLSVCSASGRLGAFAAPFAADLLGEFWRPLPAVLFGSCALVAALLVFLLPETNRQSLPDTVEDVEERNSLRVE